MKVTALTALIVMAPVLAFAQVNCPKGYTCVLIEPSSATLQLQIASTTKAYNALVKSMGKLNLPGKEAIKADTQRKINFYSCQIADLMTKLTYARDDMKSYTRPMYDCSRYDPQFYK